MDAQSAIQLRLGRAVSVCISGLAKNREPPTTDDRPPPSVVRISAFRNFSFQLLFALLAFLYAPVRLVQAANPVWTLVSWGLALVVIGLTLWFLRLALPSPSWREGDRRSDEVTSPSPLWGEGGRRPDEVFPLSAVQRCRFSDFIFPIGFFLVAVPWPSVIEGPLIQGLTRADARVTVELLGWLGIPALPHGNVIQVATGEVGIDEACSGIRSFQATLMISLFLGELYRLSGVRRAALCLGGFAMSFLFNLARMSLLVWVAASKGIAAIAAWHDPAGVTILVACFGGLWAFAVSLRHPAAHSAPPRPSATAEEPAPSTFNLQPSTFNLQPATPLASPGLTPSSTIHHPSSPRLLPPTWPLFALAAWIVLTEIGVESWYRAHEAHLPPAKQWTIAWPTNNTTFKELPLEAGALQMLKCDENRRAGWQEDDRQWQAIFIKWNPGTIVQLAHTPNRCMTGAGHTVTTIANCEWFDVGGLRLPFTVFEVMDAPQPFYIFYCMWNDRVSATEAAESRTTLLWLSGNRLTPVLTGMRNTGQRSLEIAVGGVSSAGEAESAMRAELEKILVVSTAPPP